LEVALFATSGVAAFATLEVAVLAAVLAAVDIAGLEIAAVDSTAPVALAAPALDVLETPPADWTTVSVAAVPCFAAFAAGCNFGLSSDPPTAPWPWNAP